MKAEKWYNKAGNIFEEESMKGCIATNFESGFLFSNASGTYALFIPGYSAYSTIWDKEARKSNTLRTLYEKTRENAKLATENASGFLSDRACKVREFKNETTTVYVYEKLLRMFPKNALFYISERHAPVMVGIWENDRLYEIGMVMPLYTQGNFKADK